MSHIAAVFYWVGALVCTSAALLAALWIIDFTVRKSLRAVGWWPAFVRFLWIDGNKKRALREEHERNKRGEHS